MPPVRNSEHGVENLCAEFVSYALFKHLPGVAVSDRILDYVVEDSCDDGVIVAPVARKYDCYVRRMREVGKLGPLPHLTVVMLRGESESMIDDVGIARDYHCLIVANQETRRSSPC